MSDEKLRELERRFRETGSAEDEVAWLRERARSSERLDWDSYSRLHDLDLKAAANYLQWRVETGDLTRERLELAASCGHTAAGGRSSTPELPGLLCDSLPALVLASVALGVAFARATGHVVPGCKCSARDCPSELLERTFHWLRVPSEARRRTALECGMPDYVAEPIDLPLVALQGTRSRRALVAHIRNAIRSTESKVEGGALPSLCSSIVPWALSGKIPESLKSFTSP